MISAKDLAKVSEDASCEARKWAYIERELRERAELGRKYCLLSILLTDEEMEKLKTLGYRVDVDKLWHVHISWNNV